MEIWEGVDEAWRVACDYPLELWPPVVRLKVCPVQLRARYAVGVSS